MPPTSSFAKAPALTDGTCSFSAWDEAASVVTARFDDGARAFCLKGATQRDLAVRLSMVSGDGRWKVSFGNLEELCSALGDVEPPIFGLSLAYTSFS